MLFAAAVHNNLRRRTPVLVAAGAAALALSAPAAADANRCPGAHANPNQISLADSQHATLCLLNRARRHHGLKKLHENGRLDLASVRHAQDMARRNYFEHGNFVGRIRSTSYLSGVRSWSVGENIAWGSGGLATPASIVTGWMHSAGHRANILNRDYREIGIGVARGAPVGGVSDGATYATDFGARS